MCYSDNQRKKTERRQRNDGPPFGMADRRRGEDRRQVSISEISMEEWEKHLNPMMKVQLERKSTGEQIKAELASDIFDRIGRH